MPLCHQVRVTGCVDAAEVGAPLEPSPVGWLDELPAAGSLESGAALVSALDAAAALELVAAAGLEPDELPAALSDELQAPRATANTAAPGPREPGDPSSVHH